MKRPIWILCVFILTLLSACRAEPAEELDPPEEAIRLETLSVEIPRSGLSSQDLAQTVRELPEALREALAGQSVEVETVSVSVSSSPAATAQAVNEGGVDLAFLPAGDVAAMETPPRLLLTAGDGEEPEAMAVILRPDGGALEDGAFAEALAAAVNGLAPENPVFGPYDYAPVTDGDASAPAEAG